MNEHEILQLKSAIANIKVAICALILCVILVCIYFLNPAFLSKNPDGIIYSGEIYSASRFTGWKTIEVRSFKIEVPQNFYYKSENGIDSYVGAITNKEDDFIFDYGMYNDFADLSISSQLYCYDTINGFPAIITKPKVSGKGVTGVFFYDLEGMATLVLRGDSIIENEDVVMKMMHSIRFDRSDTSINTNHSFVERYTKLPGVGFLKEYCFQCHSTRKKVVGPPLCDISRNEFHDYFMKKNFFRAPDKDTPETDFKWHRTAFKLNEEDIQLLLISMKDLCSPQPQTEIVVN